MYAYLPEEKRCTATLKHPYFGAGSRCEGARWNGTPFCWPHDPATTARRKVSRRYTTQFDAVLFELHEAGLTLQELADMADLSRTNILNRLDRHRERQRRTSRTRCQTIAATVNALQELFLSPYFIPEPIDANPLTTTAPSA